MDTQLKHAERQTHTDAKNALKYIPDHMITSNVRQKHVNLNIVIRIVKSQLYALPVKGTTIRQEVPHAWNNNIEKILTSLCIEKDYLGKTLLDKLTLKEILEEREHIIVW